ncbi:MAG: flagellar hook-associated protein FlgK [Alcaligenaceae bacterium]|nr:flagellar hook-associated protein FlgK [Alcaligenaceae bacterium]
MNLANLGRAGLEVAQNRLQTAGHNINNAATEGYNRQNVLAQTAGATGTSAGWIGRGVQAVGVQRAYDSFLYRQLMDSQVKGAALATYGDQISQVNNLFADRTVGISPAIQKFFDGIQALASAPADSAARQELLGRATSLATQIRSADAFIDDQRGNINTQISTTVTQINSHLERIDDLNQQIVIAKATVPGQPPNDLLDMRDQVVSELGQLIDIRVFEQGDRVNIAVGSGQVILGGGTVFPLATLPSEAEPSRLGVSYTTVDSSGQPMLVEIPETSISGGRLGGLLSFRAQALDTVQNDLGRLALGLATTVNEVHAAGVDMAGVAGGQFFNIGTPAVINHEGNTGTAAPVVDYDYALSVPPAVGGLSNAFTNQDYRVEFDGADYSVTTIPGGTTTALGGLPASFGGVTFDVPTGTAAAGDSWLIQPTRGAAGDLTVAITDPAKIAAAGAGLGVANGDNALALAALQTDKVLGGGSMGLNDAFSQIVNKVGVMTQQNTTAKKAQDALIQQNFSAQQAVSGVNLNEEYMNLNRFQEQFRASARLIDVSSTLFDTLLGLRA